MTANSMAHTEDRGGRLVMAEHGAITGKFWKIKVVTACKFSALEEKTSDSTAQDVRLSRGLRNATNDADLSVPVGTEIVTRTRSSYISKVTLSEGAVWIYNL